MKLIEFFLRHQREILQATLEHVWLVGLTMLFAILIGVPLGILVTRKPWLSKPILGGANIAETIPSLALFGFLLPVPWLGDRAERIVRADAAVPHSRRGCGWGLRIRRGLQRSSNCDVFAQSVSR